jgi:transposase
MRPKGSQELLEWRRYRAIALLEAGKSPAEVAEFLGVGRNTVYRWRRRYRREGQPGLAARSIPGRPPRLREEQREILLQCLAQGAQAHGFATDQWTQQRLVSLIHKLFGITFCAFHASRILAAAGWDIPKPARRAHPMELSGYRS